MFCLGKICGSVDNFSRSIGIRHKDVLEMTLCYSGKSARLLDPDIDLILIHTRICATGHCARWTSNFYPATVEQSIFHKVPDCTESVLSISRSRDTMPVVVKATQWKCNVITCGIFYGKRARASRTIITPEHESQMIAVSRRKSRIISCPGNICGCIIIICISVKLHGHFRRP